MVVFILEIAEGNPKYWNDTFLSISGANEQWFELAKYLD
jgi:hypothetical protein